MARKKKLVVQRNIDELDFFDLIRIVKKRGRGSAIESNLAYAEIEIRMRPKILLIVNQFYIAGLSKDDLYQEALFALRYKAIPDYRKNKSADGTSYPFNKFAILCIRRHLSTILKTAYQNKKRALNTSISLDQDRRHEHQDNLTLSDILPTTEGSLLEEIQDKEHVKILFGRLYQRLSPLEKKVFCLYAQNHSYEEMAEILKNFGKEYDTKRIDNALTRIKSKGKIVLEQYQRESEGRNKNDGKSSPDGNNRF